MLFRTGRVEEGVGAVLVVVTDVVVALGETVGETVGETMAAEVVVADEETEGAGEGVVQSLVVSLNEYTLRNQAAPQSSELSPLQGMAQEEASC